MQPVMQGPPLTSEHVTKSRLEQAPIDVKLMIFNSLNIKEISQLAILSKSWQKVASDKRVWVQVAKQIEAPLPSTSDPKKEVLNFCCYEGICKIVDDYLKESCREGDWCFHKDFFQQWNHFKGKDQKEKYEIALRNFRLDNFPRFITFIFSLPLTPVAIKAIKQFVDDGVLISERGKLYALRSASEHTGLFQHLINKFNGETKLLNKALKDLVAPWPSDKTACVKLLIKHGARPTVRCLENAKNEHLALLLDHCPLTLREQVLKNIENKPTSVYGVSNLKKSDLIKNAPPPTFGGQVKPQG